MRVSGKMEKSSETLASVWGLRPKPFGRRRLKLVWWLVDILIVFCSFVSWVEVELVEEERRGKEKLGRWSAIEVRTSYYSAAPKKELAELQTVALLVPKPEICLRSSECQWFNIRC